ncbi:MAG: DinB family protein [Anaerolineaceae bacterium]|nr:DinB family protein [Anaerolineaceae bacterium]
MDARLKTSLWLQYGAALDTLEDAMNLCPDNLWTVQLWADADDSRYGQFWYLTYHTLSWTDLFLGGSYEDFKPPAPFVRGKLPDQPYTKEQIYTYLKSVRAKAHTIIEGLTDEQAYQPLILEWMQAPYVEMLMYAMRHIQEHAAQLNMVLGEKGVTGQDWVAQARDRVS